MSMVPTPKVGEKAIDFELPDESNRPVRLSAEWSKAPTLLLFYPTDFGFHCAIQMGQMRENYQRFKDLGVTVLGISTNTQPSHGIWSDQMRIPFHLISDVKGEISGRYGMMCPEDSWLKGRSCRSAFLIDREGTIIFAWMPPDQSIIPDIEELISGMSKALSR